jgi:hypothetical protein
MVMKRFVASAATEEKKGRKGRLATHEQFK